MPPLSRGFSGVINIDQVNIKSRPVERMLPSEDAARRLGVKVTTVYA
jgi:hypothetical protein